MMFYNHYTYAHHLDQAKNGIDRLEEVLSKEVETSPLGASILNAFTVEDNLKDIRLKHLTAKIVNATEYAIENADTLRYTLTVEDPETYTAPWTVAFPYKRDSDYVQYEYACHEGNYAMFNRLSGAREQERSKE